MIEPDSPVAAATIAWARMDSLLATGGGAEDTRATRPARAAPRAGTTTTHPATVTTPPGRPCDPPTAVGTASPCCALIGSAPAPDRPRRRRAWRRAWLR